MLYQPGDTAWDDGARSALWLGPDENDPALEAVALPRLVVRMLQRHSRTGSISRNDLPDDEDELAVTFDAQELFLIGAPAHQWDRMHQAEVQGCRRGETDQSRKDIARSAGGQASRRVVVW